MIWKKTNVSTDNVTRGPEVMEMKTNLELFQQTRLLHHQSPQVLQVDRGESFSFGHFHGI